MDKYLTQVTNLSIFVNFNDTDPVCENLSMKINLSKFKGIAFDLDDTLIDRKKAFDKLCIKLSEDFDCFNHFSKKEALKYFWGLNSFNDFNIKSSLQQINKDFHNFGLSYQEFYDYYYKNMSEIVEAYEGASHLLDKLIEKKINFGIVTNGSHYQYQKIIIGSFF